MGATVIFYSSLLTIVVFLYLKTWELKNSVKIFSNFRHRADAYFQVFFSKAKIYLKYVNMNTAKALVLFLFEELKDLTVFLAKKIAQTNFFQKIIANIKGKISQPKVGISPSIFLQDISSHKNNRQLKEEKDMAVDSKSQ